MYGEGVEREVWRRIRRKSSAQSPLCTESNPFKATNTLNYQDSRLLPSGSEGWPKSDCRRVCFKFVFPIATSVSCVLYVGLWE
jgi:hypothetical protein